MTRPDPTAMLARVRDAKGDQRLTSRDLIGALLVALVVMGLGCARLAPGVVGTQHDDGIYLSTAQSLAEGHGYRLIDLPGQPFQTKYPPLYPLLLSAIWKLWPSFPANVIPMQLATLTSGALAIALAYLYLVRFGYARRVISLGGALLCAAAPMQLLLSTQLMAEAPFALLVVIALWRCEEDVRRERSSVMRQAATGFVIAMPLLCRLAGLPVCFAVLVTLSRHGKLRLLTAGTIATVVLGWATWIFAAHQLQSRFALDYYTGYSASVIPILGESGWRILALNAFGLAVNSAGSALDELREASGFLQPFVVLVFTAFGVAGWTFAIRASARAALLPTFLVLYGLVVLLWPWPPARFMVPIATLLFCLTAESIAAALERNANGLRMIYRPLTAAIGALGLLTSFVADARLGSLVRSTSYPYDIYAIRTRTEPRAAEPVTWDGYQKTFDWIRSHTSSTDILASGMDTMVFLYTGRAAYRPVVYRPETVYGAAGSPIGSVPEVEQRLSKAGYVVLLPGYELDGVFRQAIREIQARREGWLRPVYSSDDGRFQVIAIGRSN